MRPLPRVAAICAGTMRARMCGRKAAGSTDSGQFERWLERLLMLCGSPLFKNGSSHGPPRGRALAISCMCVMPSERLQSKLQLCPLGWGRVSEGRVDQPLKLRPERLERVSHHLRHHHLYTMRHAAPGGLAQSAWLRRQRCAATRSKVAHHRELLCRVDPEDGRRCPAPGEHSLAGDGAVLDRVDQVKV